MAPRRTTLDDVAAAAGVSRMTVSNVYGRPAVVAPTTRDRVLAAAAAIGYGGPSPLGRTLRRGSTGVLGMILNVGIPYAFSDPGAAEFMRGVAQGADEADLALQIVHAAGPSAGARVRDTAVDAFIAWSLQGDDPALAAALARRMPIVAFGGYSGRPEVPYVSADNTGGARATAQHLLDLGVRRFAAITCDLDWEQFGDRIAGWRAALEAGGVRWADVEVIDRPANGRLEGRAAAEVFLERVEPGERYGILALTDVLALGAMHTLQRAGIDVPGQVAIAGFDDIEESGVTVPGLTTVHQDIFGMGRECALRAAGRVDGPTVPHRTSLVVRGSTHADPTPTRARPTGQDHHESRGRP